jgi:hypothetical protein
MITVRWVFIALAVTSCLDNIIVASKGGAQKTAGTAAVNAVTNALLAAWLYYIVA